MLLFVNSNTIIQIFTITKKKRLILVFKTRKCVYNMKPLTFLSKLKENPIQNVVKFVIIVSFEFSAIKNI